MMLCPKCHTTLDMSKINEPEDGFCLPKSGCLRVTLITLMAVLAITPVNTTENQTASSGCKCQHPHLHIGSQDQRSPKTGHPHPSTVQILQERGVYGSDGSNSLTREAVHSQTSFMSHNSTGPSENSPGSKKARRKLSPRDTLMLMGCMHRELPSLAQQSTVCHKDFINWKKRGCFGEVEVGEVF